MLQMLWLSIFEPKILLHSTLLPKKAIRRLVCLGALIISIPLLNKGILHVSTLQQNISSINENLPKFHTVDNLIVGEESYQTTSAIQTKTAYLLYDIENKISDDDVKKLINSNDFNIIITKTTIKIYAQQSLIQELHANEGVISTSDLFNTLEIINQRMTFLYIVVPILIFISSICVILMNNLFFSFISNSACLLVQKSIRKDHIWRVSLFASILPYLVLTLFDLLRMPVPNILSECFVLLIVIMTQFKVIKSAQNI